MRRRAAFLLVALVTLGVPGHAGLGPALAATKHPIEHEPIPADPVNDVAFGLRLDGDLPAAIETRSGIVPAPDPRAALPKETPRAQESKTSLAGHDEGLRGFSRFTPDTDTRRPDALPYSDPFVPSTTPWKRLVAFDTVDEDYGLRVHDTTLSNVPTHDLARTDGSEDQFYGDLVLDLRPNVPERVPSVAAGSRVLHARLGVGAEDVDFELLRDGADNWFVRSRHGGRARLVFELSTPRAAFGGPLGDSFDDTRIDRATLALPPRVQRDANIVATRIGLPKATRRQTIEALVDYFRGFTESNEPPTREQGVYLALALSKKGVCRHRAYAFMVTAAGLGIRSRVVLNEAHAWVEVTDGSIWKRIDLGGAGTVLAETSRAAAPPHAPPPDPFRWPPGSRRGEGLARTANAAGASGGQGPGVPAASSPSAAPANGSAGEPPDTRPAPTLTVETAEAVTPREQPVHVRGTVVADGAPCAHVPVGISVRERHTGVLVPIGELATDERGAYFGVVVVPRSVVVGDYEIVAHTGASDRCRGGESL